MNSDLNFNIYNQSIHQKHLNNIEELDKKTNELTELDIQQDNNSKNINLYTKQVIFKSFYYKSVKILLNYVEDFEQYSFNIIENDIPDLLDMLNLDTEKKIRSLLIKSVLFQSLQCFRELLKTDILSKGTILTLAKFCCFFNQTNFLYEIKNRFKLEKKEIQELIYYCYENCVYEQVKKFNTKLLDQKCLDIVLDNFLKDKPDSRVGLIYTIENIDDINKIDNNIFYKLKNCEDDLILNTVTIKFNKKINDELGDDLFGSKIFDYIKLFTDKYPFIQNDIKDYNKEKKQLILKLLVEKKLEILNIGMKDKVFTIEDIKECILEQDLCDYVKLIQITSLDCLKYDSILCLRELLKKEELEKVAQLVIQHNAERCFEYIKDYTEEINLKDFYVKCLKDTNIKLFRRVYDHFNKPNYKKELLTEINVEDQLEKIKLTRPEIDIFKFIKNSSITIKTKLELLNNIEKNKINADKDGNSLEHICCLYGISSYDKLSFYYKENNQGLIPIELLNRKINKVKNFNELKELVTFRKNIIQPISKRI